MGPMDIFFLVFFIVAAQCIGLYFLYRWSYKRMGQQQEMVDRTKTTATIYVIDKKKEKPVNANFPKVVLEKLPKMYRFLKMPLVKAKVGPQILTLMCDQQVFKVLPVKKNVKVEIAGIYISGMKGMKTKKEYKDARTKKEKEREAAEGKESKLSRIPLAGKLFRKK